MLPNTLYQTTASEDKRAPFLNLHNKTNLYKNMTQPDYHQNASTFNSVDFLFQLASIIHKWYKLGSITTWFICFITYSVGNMIEFSTIHTKLYTHRMRWIIEHQKQTKQRHQAKISETVLHIIKTFMTHHFWGVKEDSKQYYLIICSKEKIPLILTD
jgi:hypothetical protein